MKVLFTILAKIVASYLFAGAAYLLYFKWPHYDGHAHVPFSGFPEFLVFAPFSPFFLLEDFHDRSANALSGALVYGASLVCSLWFFFKRRRNVRQ
ncbi:hypothetical protein [Duganella sp. CF458]|uniref:hypothetical protein n=1 Tax=Duganella sp. CF458 TaxID=1884368 RepID=UPI000B81E4CE|nr:hypothetical protein [Duganella sp. CF458]